MFAGCPRKRSSASFEQVSTAAKEATQKAATLALDGVAKRFAAGGDILRDFTLDCPKGQITCILRPSGCGKSTALRLLAGLLEPDEGKVTRPDAEASFVFQDPTLMPWRRVIDNVRLPLELRGEPRRLAVEPWQSRWNRSLSQPTGGRKPSTADSIKHKPMACTSNVASM